MKNLQAKDIMNANLLVAGPEMTASELAAFLTDNEISGAPVVGEDGELLGVVSLTDLARSVSESGAVRPDRSDPDYFLRGWEERYNAEDLKFLRIEGGEMTVRDLMSDSVRTVDEEMPVRECAEKMLGGHLHRLLVTRGDKLVGILTTFDLIQLVADKA